MTAAKGSNSNRRFIQASMITCRDDDLLTRCWTTPKLDRPPINANKRELKNRVCTILIRVHRRSFAARLAFLLYGNTRFPAIRRSGGRLFGFGTTSANRASDAFKGYKSGLAPVILHARNTAARNPSPGGRGRRCIVLVTGPMSSNCSVRVDTEAHDDRPEWRKVVSTTVERFPR